jgi:hypothetical protein
MVRTAKVFNLLRGAFLELGHRIRHGIILA